MVVTTPTVSNPSPFYSDTVLRRINYRVSRLRRNNALSAEDAKELRQDFLLTLVRAEHRYDPARCPVERYISMVLNWRYKYHVRRLAELDESEAGDVISLEELDPGYPEFFVDEPAEQRLRQIERRHDIDHVLAELPAEDQRLCRLLMEHPPYEIAALLGVAHGTVYRRIRRLRRHFIAAGLGGNF